MPFSATLEAGRDWVWPLSKRSLSWRVGIFAWVRQCLRGIFKFTLLMLGDFGYYAATVLDFVFSRKSFWMLSYVKFDFAGDGFLVSRLILVMLLLIVKA